MIRARSSFGRFCRLSRRTRGIHTRLTAATWAIAMALGPVLQIRKIVEHNSSKSVSTGYFFVLLVGFVL